MAEDDAARYLKILARSEAILSGEPVDATDDRALEQTVAALSARAWALFNLNQFAESLAAAVRSADYVVEHGLDDHWYADALAYKRASLARLGREEEAAIVDAELTYRFRDSDDPHVRLRAAEALSFRSHALLRTPARLADGLALSDELIEMLDEEPDDSVLEMVRVAARHMRLVVHTHSPSLGGFAAIALELGVANAATFSGVIASRLLTRTGLTVPELTPVETTVSRLTPGRLHRTRLRARQSLKVGAAALARLEALSASEAAGLTARIELQAALSRVILGHGNEGLAAIEALHRRRDPDVAGAYQALVDEQAETTSPIIQLATAALLWGRAQALIGDDPAMARLAYEDSVAAHLPAGQRWPLRWLIALLAPGR